MRLCFEDDHHVIHDGSDVVLKLRVVPSAVGIDSGRWERALDHLICSRLEEVGSGLPPKLRVALPHQVANKVQAMAEADFGHWAEEAFLVERDEWFGPNGIAKREEFGLVIAEITKPQTRATHQSLKWS